MMMYVPKQDNGGPKDTVRAMLKSLLEQSMADAVMVQAQTPWSALPMPTLFTDPSKMDGVDPLAPAAPVSGARQAVSLTRNPSGKKIAMVLRPCEIRAVIELIKLNQASLTDVVLISMECDGRMENNTFVEQAAANPDITDAFLESDELKGKITKTCASCDRFMPDNADITVCAGSGKITFEASSDQGKEILEALGMTTAGDAKAHEDRRQARLDKRSQAKQALFEETANKLNTIDGFETYIGRCLNCYNCRAACPVCYCKECVFLTDVYAHPSDLLLERAARRGAVKLPTDTSMFHMTRLSHIGHACIGCGQCSSVCPSDIPVTDMFRTISEKTQAFYHYTPGKDVNDPIPQLAYREKSQGKQR